MSIVFVYYSFLRNHVLRNLGHRRGTILNIDFTIAIIIMVIITTITITIITLRNIVTNIFATGYIYIMLSLWRLIHLMKILDCFLH